MKKDENCFYCQKSPDLYEIMIEICPLTVSTLYLFKDQTHKGRCVVAYKDHVKDISDLNDKELLLFMKDVTKASRAISKAFSPDKVNYGAYADTLHHLHFHIVPKYKGQVEFGGTFAMSRDDKVTLSSEEYQKIIDDIKQNL